MRPTAPSMSLEGTVRSFFSQFRTKIRTGLGLTLCLVGMCIGVALGLSLTAPSLPHATGGTEGAFGFRTRQGHMQQLKQMHDVTVNPAPFLEAAAVKAHVPNARVRTNAPSRLQSRTRSHPPAAAAAEDPDDDPPFILSASIRPGTVTQSPLLVFKSKVAQFEQSLFDALSEVVGDEIEVEVHEEHLEHHDDVHTSVPDPKHRKETEKASGFTFEAAGRTAAAAAAAAAAAPLVVSRVPEVYKCPDFLPRYDRGTTSPCFPISLADYPVPKVQNEEHCSSVDFGNALLERWSKASKIVCTPRGEGTTQGSLSSPFGPAGIAHDPSDSSIVQYSIRQARHTGPDYFYHLKNIEWIPPGAIGGQKFTANCDNRDWRPAQSLALVREMVTFYSHFRYEPLSFNEAKPLHSGRNITAAWAGVHTFFQPRDCRAPFNPFHCLGDPVNLFLVLQALKIEPKDVRIIFPDEDQDESTFIDVWQAMAGQGVYTAAQVKKREHPFDTDGPILLENAYLGMPSGMNMIWKDGHVVDICGSRAPLLQAFNKLSADVLIGLHGREIPTITKLATPIQPQPPPPQQTAPATTNAQDQQLQVATVPASYKLPRVDRSVFRILINSRNKARYRRASNENILFARLKEAFPKYEVLQRNMVDLAFAEQVALMSSATVILGMHGAGLCLIHFHAKPSEAHLVEFFRGENDRPRMYENMSRRLAMGYSSWTNQDPGKNTDLETELDLDAIMQLVKDAVQDLEKKGYPSKDEL